MFQRFAVLAVMAGMAFSASAQIKNNGPMSIVVAYKSSPDKRPAFRQYVQTKLVPRLVQWKADGAIKDFQVFAAAFSGQRVGNLDIALILDFENFAGTEKWRALERKMPGGLSVEGMALGWAEHAMLTYPVGEGRAKQHNAATAIPVLGFYEATVGDAEYVQYARGYVEPQFKGWLEAGILSAYRMFMIHPGQNPGSVPYTFLVVKQYRDATALSDSDAVKEKVRQELEKITQWKALSDVKSTKRKARGFVIAEPILPASR